MSLPQYGCTKLFCFLFFDYCAVYACLFLFEFFSEFLFLCEDFLSRMVLCVRMSPVNLEHISVENSNGCVEVTSAIETIKKNFKTPIRSFIHCR